jgi:hypothetical protein
MLLEEIQSKIWGLSVSAGTSPYTILSFTINEELKSLVGSDYLTGYTQGIAFFIWEDYTLEDYRDYLTHSKEYLVIADDTKRAYFLHQQFTKNMQQEHFHQWQHNQMYIALGFAIQEIRSTAASYKVAAPAYIESFKQWLHIKGGVMKEVLLF